MLRTLKGIVLGLIAQGVGHAFLAWAFQVHIFPPNAWHLLPFVAGGLVCGSSARGALAALWVAPPYVALVILADLMVDPGVSATTIVFALAGIILAAAACGWRARRRRAAVPAAG
jgi:hypothetical protein